MSKHTLGPWESEHEQCDPRPYPDDPGFFTITAPILGRPVADTMNRDHCISPEEDEANARLIAAAPELLAALKAICNTWGEAACIPGPSLDDLVEEGRAVIAKAEAKLPAYKYQETFCSQCGGEFGPGNHGFSHCENHKHLPRLG